MFMSIAKIWHHVVCKNRRLCIRWQFESNIYSVRVFSKLQNDTLFIEINWSIGVFTCFLINNSTTKFPSLMCYITNVSVTHHTKTKQTNKQNKTKQLSCPTKFLVVLSSEKSIFTKMDLSIFLAPLYFAPDILKYIYVTNVPF